MLNKVVAGLLGAGFVLVASPAFAGEWKLNARACPDLVEDHRDRIEDRRDSRVDYGRRDRIEDRFDRRENRRDEAVTICPIRAFYYQPDRNELRRAQRGRQLAAWQRPNARPPLQYDRRARMYFRYANGRKIYVRG